MNEVTAHINVLTAEVRTLMVGSRQVTMSVFRQLDVVHEPWRIEPFGRVRADPPEKYQSGVWIVGKKKEDGALVRTWVPYSHPDWFTRGMSPRDDSYREAVDQWKAIREEAWRLPLIVLAGLR